MTKILKPLVDVNGVATHRHVNIDSAITTRDIAAISPVLSKTAWANERESALELLEEIGTSIVTSNHGAFPNIRPEVNLHDMAIGEVARGNCWSIVNELIEIAGTEYFGDYVDELNINTRKGLSHTGLFVKNGNVEYVLDYTIRQFDEKLEFPFIASVEEWKATVERAYGQSFVFTPASNEDDEDEDNHYGDY